MNIFQYYISVIHNLVLNHKNDLKLKNIDSLNNISLEVPPEQFNCDLSCNASLILAKPNKLNPKDLAIKLKDLFQDKINHFYSVEIAGPGFLNIKLSNEAIIKSINSILENNETYGSLIMNETYNIEFVSANPTGPMHVGHCRGAIYGDVLANLLKFNGNKITKEYYINDYGNQIKNFVESVYLRIKEIKFNEKYPTKENLYPGYYIKEIAKIILDENKKKNFDIYEKNYEFLREKSLYESMKLIKSDLKKLGISHDNFFSETELVNKDLVKQAIDKLKKKNISRKDIFNLLKGMLAIIGKKQKD